jgi:mRNA interferase RelE/StbE
VFLAQNLAMRTVPQTTSPLQYAVRCDEVAGATIAFRYAVDDLRRLPANTRSVVRAAIETHLRYEPGKISRSRIKRLRGLEHPQYRLRVGEVRVFYDILDETTVEVLAIVSKAEVEAWLVQFENPL